jgi:hypothetical protein
MVPRFPTRHATTRSHVLTPSYATSLNSVGWEISTGDTLKRKFIGRINGRTMYDTSDTIFVQNVAHVIQVLALRSKHA